MVTFNNFFNNTKVIFKGCKTPKREPDFISNTGSKYWYGNDKNGGYVIREADHWVTHKAFNKEKKHKQCTSISSCIWSIKTNIESITLVYDKYYNKYLHHIDYNRVSGKAYLNDFIPINH